mgnify:CR=1 FL=1
MQVGLVLLLLTIAVCNGLSWCKGEPNFRAMVFVVKGVQSCAVCVESDITKANIDWNTDGKFDSNDIRIMTYLWKKNRRVCGETEPGLSGN